MRVLNDPTHVCTLPDPLGFTKGTNVMCEEVIVGGRYADGRCGRQYTRSGTSIWRGPRWLDYDYGW